MEQRKEWFRDNLIDWVKTNRKADFNTLSTIEQSKEMTRFYLKEIVAKVTPGALPDDEDDIDDYVVDGANDGGADFIYRSDNSVLIIQSKFRGRGKNEEQESLSHFFRLLQRLYDASSGKGTFNRKVMEAISDIDWENDFFDLRFCTLGKVDEGISFESETINIPGLSDIGERVELVLQNETELNKSLREAISAGKETKKTISLRFVPTSAKEHWLKFESEGGREMYAGWVSGMELAQLFQEHKYRLFAMNIRDYVGETATNKGIVATVKDSADDFVFFNNGISAVATRVAKNAKDDAVLDCDQFSIINGAQTVRSLFKAHSKRISTLKEVRLLFRIVLFKAGKDGTFLSDVTRFNNTQNLMRVSDFRSNDPVQKHLRSQFSAISVGAKTCDYKNKRRQERDSNKFPIGMEDFAKTIHSFRYGPDDMFGGTRYLFDVSTKGGYRKVFGDPDMHLSSDDFALAAGTYFMCHAVEGLWKDMRELDSTPGGLERRWPVYFAVGELLRQVYARTGKPLEDDLRFLANPNKWMNSPSNPIKAAVKEVFELASTALEQSYRKASGDTDFKHRNWFRSEDTLKAVKEELSVIPKYRKNDLPLLRPKARADSGAD